MPKKTNKPDAVDLLISDAAAARAAAEESTIEGLGYKYVLKVNKDFKVSERRQPYFVIRKPNGNKRQEPVTRYFEVRCKDNLYRPVGSDGITRDSYPEPLQSQLNALGYDNKYYGIYEYQGQ